MKEEFDSALPLSPATLHILLSLACEELHGYGIMQEIARQSEGKYKLGPGTLYDNPRRRYYALTAAGRGVLDAETARLAQVVREARSRLKFLKPRRV